MLTKWQHWSRRKIVDFELEIVDFHLQNGKTKKLQIWWECILGLLNILVKSEKNLT